MRLTHHALSLVLAGLLAVTGCGGDSNDGGGGDEDAAATTGAMTASEIEDVLLPVGTRIGTFRVRETPMAELLDGTELEAAECQPLASLVPLEPEPAASARRSAGGPRLEDLTVQIQLLSYGDQAAADVFGQIEEAVSTCADGYEIDPVFAHSAAVSVEPLPAPSVGDAATAYRVATEATGSDGDDALKLWSCVAVAHAGQELLLFQTQSLVEEPCEEVPVEVIDAQWERYADAVG